MKLVNFHEKKIAKLILHTSRKIPGLGFLTALLKRIFILPGCGAVWMGKYSIFR
jgi:hypothetical protein